MNHEMQDLARRAVACEHWHWMPGMLAVDGAERFRVSIVSHGYPQGVDEQPPMKVNVDLGLRWLPGLTDPATLGCLLALVREAWGDPNVTPYQCHRSDCLGVTHSDVGLYWEIALDGYLYYGPSETAALVAALEAAP